MKKTTLILIALAIGGSGCTLSPEKKAQEAIKEYLVKNLDDAKSYESIEFSALLNDYTKFEDTLLGKKLSDSLNHYRLRYRLDSTGIENCKKEDCQKGYLNYLKESIKLTKQKYIEAQTAYDKEKPNFKSEFRGFIISHTYRAKNKFGGYVKESHWFYLDKDFHVYQVL
jgi:hypothetical protein